jgi:hypothetical protein
MSPISIVKFAGLLVVACSVAEAQFATGDANLLILPGSNSWGLHTPDDGRNTLYFAPQLNGAWSWENGVSFNGDGSIDLNNTVRINGGNIDASSTGSIDDPWAKWTSVGDKSYPTYPLYLGSNRYGIGFIWESDGVFFGMSDEGYNRKDAIIAWGDDADDNLRFLFNGTEKVRVNAAGNVGIGTTNPTHKLAVNGMIKAKEVIVETTGWSDYVFADDYALAPLAEVEAHIKEHKHLPGIPSVAQVAEQGVSVGDMQARLLAKVEELTLYVIELKKENAEIRGELNAQRATSH